MFSLERTDMKTILTVLFVMTCSFVQAQSELFEKKVSFNNQRVDIDAELVDKITISNWTEKQVGVMVKYSINDGDLNDEGCCKRLWERLAHVSESVRLFKDTNFEKADIEQYLPAPST